MIINGYHQFSSLAMAAFSCLDGPSYHKCPNKNWCDGAETAKMLLLCLRARVCASRRAQVRYSLLADRLDRDLPVASCDMLVFAMSVATFLRTAQHINYMISYCSFTHELNAIINIYSNSSTIHALSKLGCTPLETQEVQRKWLHDTYVNVFNQRAWHG